MMDKPEDGLCTHPKTLLAGLNNLRQSDKFVDVTLIVEGVHMKAHRVVLAACSDYFAAMFLGSMKESKQFDIVMNGVSGKGMNMLLEYIYTSKLSLNNDNIEDILSTATHIQTNQVVAACSAYLEDHVSLENCADVASLADMYQLEELKEKVYRLLCSRIEEFSRIPEFQNLTCEQLDYALHTNFTVDCAEDTIAEIVSDYCVRHNVSKEWIHKLFAGIQFQQINNINPNKLPNFKFIYNSDNAPSYLHKMYGDLTKFENEEEEDVADTSNSPGKKGFFNARGMQLALIEIGGFDDIAVNNKVNVYFPNEDKWYELTSILAYCGAAVLGHEIFFFGDVMMVEEFVMPENFYNGGLKYNSITDEWKTYAKVPTRRYRFSLQAVGKYLYAIGGESTFAAKNVVSNYILHCERYNSITDEWDTIAPLIEPRSHHSGTNYKLFLYISGGIYSSVVLDTLWCYDILHDSWVQKKSMPKPRAGHVLVTVDDQIYACGGWNEDLDSHTNVLIPEIEVYDIETDTWRFETINPEPSFYTGIAALDRKIYFVGGVLSEDKTRFSDTMHVYDVVTKEWSTRTTPENKKWGCCCTTIYVPLERRE